MGEMMLDKLSPEMRHLSLIVMVVILSWAASTIPQLDLNPLIAPLAGGLVTALLAYFTPLTRQYGYGEKQGDTPPNA
jgi:H+/Cl- antiporter ClcA